MAKAKYYITTKMLTDNGACRPSGNEFKRLFPSGRMDVTEDNIKRILKRNGQLASNLNWPARTLWYKTHNHSPLEAEALEVRHLLHQTRDPASIVNLLNRVGDLWARYKQGER